MRFATMLMIVVLLLGGCKKSASYSVVRAGGWDGAPPAPRDQVVLTLITPDGHRYDLDRAGLERLTWVRRTTHYHPHETEPPSTFEGVLLEQIVRELGLTEKGLVVRFKALDDYQIERPWAQLAPLEPILALVQDGRPLTMESYGPVRIIFPYDRLKPDPIRYNALWVWQLRVIEFHY